MSEISKVINVGDIYTNLINPSTGLSTNYKKVTTWYDGSAMDLTKVDGVIYKRKLAEYFRNIHINNVLKISDVGEGLPSLIKAVSVADKVKTVNTLLIDKDIDLLNQNIEIPENVILEFNGGSLSNGTLIGNNTIIKHEKDNSFNNIILLGVWFGNDDNILTKTDTFFDENIIIGNTIKSNIISLYDSNTNEKVEFEEIQNYYDGSPMDDSKLDNVIYRKKGSQYYKRVLINNTVNVRWFGAKGDANYSDTVTKKYYVDSSKTILATNDIDAIQAACSLPFHVYFPKGNYLMEESSVTGNRYIALRGGVTYFGDGKKESILIQNIPNVLTGEGGWGQLYIDSGSETSFVENTILRDLGLDGSNHIWGKQQWTHLFAPSGTKNTLIENCGFYNFRGDGVFVSGAPKYDLAPDGITYLYARHNFDLTVRKCLFDGGFDGVSTTRENRTGIAIIDCDGVVIDDCIFQNIGRVYDAGAGDGGFGLGAIDIERDKNDLSKTRQIRVINSTFRNVPATNQGGVTLINGDSRDNWTDYLLIEGNLFENCYWGVQVSQGNASKYTTANLEHTIINNNVFRGCNQSLMISGKGFTIENNHFIGLSSGKTSYVNFGNIGTGYFVKNVKFSNNTFTGAFTGMNGVVLIKTLEDAEFSKNTNNSTTSFIQFLPKDTFTMQRFDNIRFIQNISTGALYNFSAGSTTANTFFCGTIKSEGNICKKEWRVAGNVYQWYLGETGMIFPGEIMQVAPTKGTWYQGNELFYHHSETTKYKRVCTKSGTYGGPQITTDVTIVLNQNYVEIANADTLGFLVGMIVEVSNNVHPILRTKITQITSTRIYFDAQFAYGPSVNSIKTVSPTWVDVV